MERCCLCLVFLAVVFLKVHSQTQFTERRSFLQSSVGDCPEPNVNVLTGLITEVFPTSDGVQAPTVSINGLVVVCQATGLTSGTVGSFSAVVNYTCSGTQPLCDGRILIDQFQFDCSSDNGYLPPGVAGGEFQTSGVTFTLDPPRTLEQQCGQCIVDGNNLGISSDPDSHCAACRSACNEGQRWCTGIDSDAQCCNWFLENQCVITCPGALQGDMETFDCGCGELTLANGDITYSDRFAVGSIATHTCDSERGYLLSGSNQRTCVLPANPSEAGWGGEALECELHSCDANQIEQPENGNVNIQSSTFGSVVTYSCKEDFELDGDEQRTCTLDGWTGSTPTCKEKTTAEPPLATDKQGGSGCGTPCIIGIVVGILGAIGLAAVLVGLAYALYHFFGNPNTKLNKLDPNGINGVARDNPLYVDPDAVVGTDAVVGAEAA